MLFFTLQNFFKFPHLDFGVRMENFSLVPQRIYQDTLLKAIFGREEHKSWVLSSYNFIKPFNFFSSS